MADEELAEAQQEWDLVEQHQHLHLRLQAQEGTAKAATLQEVTSILMSHAESCGSKPFECAAIQSRAELGFFARFRRLLFGPATLGTSQIRDVKVLLQLACAPLDTLDDGNVMALLSTLYFQLTRNPLISRYGSHWQDIGFQGNDPGTDLRGVGLFGMLLLLRLTAKTSLVERMFAQSSGETTNFPFCTCLLTLAKSTLALLKDGSLNLRIIECSSEEAVDKTFEHLFLTMEKLWFSTAVSERNVSTAGEIIRKIDARPKFFLAKSQKLHKKSAPVASNHSPPVDIDVIKF